MNSKLSPDVPAAVKSPDPPWSGLVERIRAGDPSAMEELYAVFAKGVRFYLWRQLGPQDLHDKVHDVFLILTKCIQKGELREPDRLMDTSEPLFVVRSPRTSMPPSSRAAIRSPSSPG